MSGEGEAPEGIEEKPLNVPPAVDGEDVLGSNGRDSTLGSPSQSAIHVGQFDARPPDLDKFFEEADLEDGLPEFVGKSAAAPRQALRKRQSQFIVRHGEDITRRRDHLDTKRESERWKPGRDRRVTREIEEGFDLYAQPHLPPLREPDRRIQRPKQKSKMPLASEWKNPFPSQKEKRAAKKLRGAMEKPTQAGSNGRTASGSPSTTGSLLLENKHEANGDFAPPTWRLGNQAGRETFEGMTRNKAGNITFRQPRDLRPNQTLKPKKTFTKPKPVF